MKFFPLLLLSLLVTSCRNVSTSETSSSTETIATPVTVTSLEMSPMSDWVELNAISGFLQRSYVKASTNGYIIDVNVRAGSDIRKGQHLFTLQTKEASSLGNTIDALDTSFKFTGNINIRAGGSGYLAELNHQVGDYVQEGEQLAAINDLNSFVFVLNIPYEYESLVAGMKSLDLLLPDGTVLKGKFKAAMPVVDSVTQTQSILIKVEESHLPANLIARVKVQKNSHPKAISLPKQAVLSDETQTDFWVMRVIDSSHAVKVPVKLGLSADGRIEILEPVFQTKDQFLLTGNYGLEDTAAIIISGN